MRKTFGEELNGCSIRRPKFDSQHPKYGSQLSVRSQPSSGLPGHHMYVHMVHRHTCMQNTRTCKIIIIIKYYKIKIQLKCQLGGYSLACLGRAFQMSVYALNQCSIFSTVSPRAGIHRSRNQGEEMAVVPITITPVAY